MYSKYMSQMLKIDMVLQVVHDHNKHDACIEWSALK